MTLRDLNESLGLHLPPKRVLVVEDHLPLLHRLAEYLEESGHEVTALQGVTEVSGSSATGPGPGDEVVEVDLRDVQVAFLDHYFLSREWNGARLARELTLWNDPKILGMSSDARANQRILEAGATLTLPKAELMRLLALS